MTDYREKYKFLKRKLKILVYEHESLTQELEKSQRKLLKVTRDNSFLLDRLLQYEKVITDAPGDSEATSSSDSDTEPPQKKKHCISAPSTNRIIKQEASDKKDTNEEKPEKTYPFDKTHKETSEVKSAPMTTIKCENEETEVDMRMPSDEAVS